MNRVVVAPTSGDVEASAPDRSAFLSPRDRDLLAKLRAERNPDPADLEREWRNENVMGTWDWARR